MPEEDRTGKTPHAGVKGEFVGRQVPPDGKGEEQCRRTNKAEADRPRYEPDEEYPATESRMVQARYEPDGEYPATESRMAQVRYESDEEYPATESRMVQARYEPEEETYS